MKCEKERKKLNHIRSLLGIGQYAASGIIKISGRTK